MKRFLYILIFIIIIIGVFYYLVLDHSSALKGRCSEYKTQDKAQEAFNNGAIWLDGYDRDKIACEMLPLN